MVKRSAIYEGTLRHKRRKPVVHEFSHSLGWLAIDLDEWNTVFRGRWLWSASRPALATIRRRDYLGDEATPLRLSVEELVKDRTGSAPSGRILLLTQPRYFGYGFNPVSFYFCFDASGREVETVVAEVNNTPWGEKHCYVLAGQRLRPDTASTFHAQKEFHVSPFMDMDMTYRFTLTFPGRKLAIGIRNYERGRCVFDASMILRRRELTPGGLARLLVRFPFQAQRVIVAIYWHALRLWWKGVPFRPHPGRATPMAERETA